MMIMQGASALMKHQSANAAASAANALKYRRDLAIKSQYQMKMANARQSFADINTMRIKNRDIKADVMLQNRLKELRVSGSIAALAGPSGQSTNALKARSLGQVLQGENSFLKDMDTKNLQLSYKDREITQGMDMAWLDANAQIAGTSYQSGPGPMGLVFGMGEAYMKSKTYESQMNS
jgi:hypothetical protein